MFTISVIERYHFPETPNIRSGIYIQKLILVKLKHFLTDVPALIAVPALVWEIVMV